ncbi:MAG: YgeY family selenium metabolism-linked hydrolase [Desulfobacteraceae bacterium]|nr:YgeY family selenium metabolism-linked hydrolase [Desulfobacteraceae bacterium]
MATVIEAELIRFAQELVKLRSYTGQEKELAMFIKDKMTQLAYDQVKVDGLGNVFGVIGNGPTKILFDSHIDTVEVNDAVQWSVGAFSGAIVNGKLYGRGAVDMKSAVAASVYAGHAIKKLGLDKGKTIYISTSVMEEDYDGEPVHYLLENSGIRPDYAIICEPSNSQLALGHKGRALIKVDVQGVSAHGSAPEKGVNAVYKMNAIIKRVEALGQKFMGIQGDRGSLALTKIDSDAVSLNAIPDHCRIYLDRRLVMGEDEQGLAQEMELLLDGTDATWEIHSVAGKSWKGEDIVLHSFLPAWEIDEAHELTTACVSAFEELNGCKPRMTTWDFSTNGVATSKRGIPTIGFGPGDDKLAHSRDEHCPVSAIVRAFEFYTNLVAHF